MRRVGRRGPGRPGPAVDRRRATGPNDAVPDALRDARTCYNHLAGRLGVALADAFLCQGWLADPGDRARHYAVTDLGAARFAAWGIATDALRRQRHRPVARKCLDWSERRHHLAGPLATAVLDLMLRNDWLRRSRHSERAVHLTPLGRAELRTQLGLTTPSPSRAGGTKERNP